MQKLFLRVHPTDNVAIVLPLDGIAKGSESAGITAAEFIPQAHKIVTARIAAGEPVIRYGQMIGMANRELWPGNYAREEHIDLPEPPPLDKLPIATAVPAPLPPLAGYTFQGYRNPDGSVGTRNVLAISTTVQCTAPTVDYAVKRIRPKFCRIFRTSMTWLPSPTRTVVALRSMSLPRKFQSVHCAISACTPTRQAGRS